MDRRAAWVIGTVFGGLFLCLFGFLLVLFIAVKGGGDSNTIGSGSGPRVGIIEVVGAIEDSKKLLKDMKAFEQDENIKAVVIRIDSPGGGVGASQEIYEAIKKLRAKKKVVASMGGIAASGGFYVAMAAEKIYANPGTLTGSIGVIFQIPNFTGVMKWAGVQMNVITAGKMKDAGSPFREMAPEERQYFEGVLADVHEQFIKDIADGRAMKPEDVRPYADGRVFSGRQAKEYKLVDELGGLQDAVDGVAKLAGLEGEPKMEYPAQEKKLLRELLGEEASSIVRGATKEALNEVGGTGLQFRMPMVQTQ